MSNFESGIQPFTGPEQYPFINILDIQGKGNKLLSIVEQKILDNQEFLSKNGAVNVYLRPSSLLLEVFILVDHKLINNEAKIWWEFICSIEKEFSERVTISVGDTSLWKRNEKRNGWKEMKNY